MDENGSQRDEAEDPREEILSKAGTVSRARPLSIILLKR
jgi:hypothetical protein